MTTLMAWIGNVRGRGRASATMLCLFANQTRMASRALALAVLMVAVMSGCSMAVPAARPTPRPLRITSLPLPTQYVRGQNHYDLNASALIFGPDGNLWIAAGGLLLGAMDPVEGGVIGRVHPATGRLDWYQPLTFDALPNDLTVVPDGNLWFTENAILPVGVGCCATIGRITTSGTIQEYPIAPPAGTNHYVTAGGIMRGPDGNIWFTLQIANNFAPNGPAYTGEIGVMSTTGKLLHTYMLPSSNNVEIDASVPGPDGNLWFTVTHVNNSTGGPTQVLDSEIGHISATGAVSEYPLPETRGFPSAMATGPDGNLWVAVSLPPQFIASELLRVTPAGKVTQVPLPRMSDSIDGLAAGPDGNLWFTHDAYEHDAQTHTNQLARLTMSGQLTEFPLGTSTHSPGALTIGPDHALWFVAGDAIGRIG